MADEMGMAFDEVKSVASAAADIFSTLQTIRDICDGTCAALAVASAIPGAAAITGPVINTFMSIRPTLSSVIAVGDSVSTFLGTAVSVMEGADALVDGKMDAFVNEASALAQQAAQG